LLADGAGATTYTVNASGGGMFTRIQDAVNYASNGDTIRVHSGKYDEYININKQLIIRGIDTGSGKPVIKYTGIDSPYVVSITASDVIFKGFNYL